jgi:hypothetical protein
MRVLRLDLGVDIVVVPDRNLILLHPDLSFPQAVGAIRGALPDLHPDVVVNLVSQVTQRPQPRRAAKTLLGLTLLTAVFVGAHVMTDLSGPFGGRWRNAVAALELTCDEVDDTRVCTAPDGLSYEVTAWTRSDGALYVLRSDGRRRYVRSFVGDVPATWLRNNPTAEVLSSSTVHWE